MVVPSAVLAFDGSINFCDETVWSDAFRCGSIHMTLHAFIASGLEYRTGVVFEESLVRCAAGNLTRERLRDRDWEKSFQHQEMGHFQTIGHPDWRLICDFCCAVRHIEVRWRNKLENLTTIWMNDVHVFDSCAMSLYGRSEEVTSLQVDLHVSAVVL